MDHSAETISSQPEAKRTRPLYLGLALITVLLILLIVGLVTLVACSISQTTPPTNLTTPDNALASQDSLPKLSAPAGPVSPAEATRQASLGDPVGLAYNPGDGSLLKADSQGLTRWQAGTGWQSVTVPSATRLTGVVVNPTVPDNLYVAGPHLGVSRSDDRGASWHAANTGLASQEVTALAMHSLRRETLYAWVSSEGIYRTEDGGRSWQKVSDVPIPDPNVYGLTHSPLPGSMNTGWLYAATPSGAYLSMD